eukprot:Gb_34384 [translate_table: standard]
MYNYPSLVLQKSLDTNAHMGRRVAAHHFEVYIYGSRNEIAIPDPDKTLIYSQNTCHSTGSPIHGKVRSLSVNTNSLSDEIIEQMAMRIDRSCINDYQWRIGGFLTNYSGMHFFSKKIRSRTFRYSIDKERNGKRNSLRGSESNQQPDRVVIMNADRESSVILEVNQL